MRCRGLRLCALIVALALAPAANPRCESDDRRPRRAARQRARPRRRRQPLRRQRPRRRPHSPGAVRQRGDDPPARPPHEPPGLAGRARAAAVQHGHARRGRLLGGFDCSGFVWRVYKYEAYPGAGRLADTLKGRTTYAMSGEVPAAKRIPYAKLQPGDVVFFGRGPASKPAQIGHMGIYVGNGWLVHSSGYGVAVAQMSSGWYRASFAWGRRPLAEAGVSGF